MALDTLAFQEADAETFQQLEKTLFAAPRARDETLMKFTNRIRSEQKELVRLLPNALNETAMGFLLLRGAGLAKTERNQVLIQTGYDYDVNKLVAILKRMTGDNAVTEKTSTTRTASYLAGIREEEPQEATEDKDEDNPIYDAMANLLGIDDDKEPDDKLESGEALTEAEALDCLAALVGPPPKPRTWGEARKIVADKKTNRGFHNIENKVRATGGFFAMTVLQDDEVCSYVATEAKMAARSNVVEHVTLAIDIGKSGRPGWGAVDTACGFNMMGLVTFDAWAKRYKDVHSITLETVPCHKKYRFGNDQVCTATEGVFIPIMLGHFSGVIFACLVKGAAPLLLSKAFVVELKASLHAFQSELDLPEQNVRLPLAHAGGEHFLVQLDNFVRPWKKPESWTLCSREVSMDFGASSEYIHLSSTSGNKDLERPPTTAGQAEATEAAAKPVNPQKDPKVRDNPERGKVFQWPWHEIDNRPRPPTGAMICRFLDIPNQGPCPPKGNPRQARDHDPARETACVREFTGHGGNGRAFWVQCCGCKMHLGHCPQSAPGMMKVINMLNDFKDDEARIKGWKPGTTKTSSKKNETEARPTATNGTASTSPRTTSRTNPMHQDNRCQKDELEEETEDWEQLGEPPRSKALTALRELLQKLSDKQNSMINTSIKQISDFEDLTQAVEAAISESSAFVNQVNLNFEPELDHLKEDDRAERSLTNKEIVTLMGSHLLTRMGQREVWSKLQHSASLVVVTNPPKDIYNTKLKEKVGKEMPTFISDVAIKQAVNGRYFYYEQDMNSRDWGDPLIKKLKRLPDIGEDGALRKGRKYFSNLPNEATEYAKLLSQELVNRPPHTALGDIDDSLQELVGALVRTIIKMKTTKEPGEQIEEQNDQNNGTRPNSHKQAHRQQVHKIHESMGHCSNENLVMVLKYGKARQAFVEAAQKLECPSCEANRRPKLAKPSKAPTTYQFNDVIGMDIFFVLGPENTTKVPMLNIVCRGTGHQVAIPLPSQHGLQIRRHYRAFWKRVYGVPRMIVIDGEKGVSAGGFPEAAEGDGSEIKVTSATSPWQAGKTERAGGTWKETFYRTRQKFNTNNWEDFYELVDAVNVAMGESVRRGGFTPYQRIFGRPFRLPEKILEEGPPRLSTVSRAMNGDTELARSIDMRKAAMAANIEAECSENQEIGVIPGEAVLTSCQPVPGMDLHVAAWEQIDNAMKKELNTKNRGAASQPPITEIEKAADVNPGLIPMATKYYDHLDDVPFTIKQNVDNPTSAMPVSERIAVIEDKINKEAEAPPKKKVKKVKAPVVSSAMLTNTNQRLRKEITEKSLLNTYKYQPYIAAERREWGNIKNAKAIRLLPPAEAAEVRQDPDRASRIMGSRWVLADMGGNPEEVDASKRQLMFLSDGTWRMAEARWTVQGHADPDLLYLETYSPVVGKDSMFLILQILCSNKWILQLADITSAVTAGDPLDRSQGSLYVELPRTGIPNVEGGSLVELLEAVYGLGDAPLQWLSAFTKYAKEIGFQCSMFDSCVFYLRDEKGLHGIMGLTVDDIVGGGDVLFDTACQKLRGRFPFGAWRHKSGKYTGKELQQNEDNTEITISQSFSSSSIQLINIATERKMPNLVVDDLLEANRIGRMTKEFSSVILRIKHIPFHEMAFAVFNDAAWPNARDGASQAGCIVFATQRNILKGEPAIISIQSWKSHKLKRKCAHQFGAETLAISEGMAMAEFIRTMLLEIMDSEFDLMRPYMLASKFPVIIVTDSHVTNPKTGLAEDKRAAIDGAIVRAAMQRPEVHLRWIEGTRHLTDPLTKRKGESALLRQALHDGEYGITADSIVLRRRCKDRVRRQKKEPTNFAVTNCCFSGPHLYGMDCTGTLGATSNVDDLNYEPEAYKRLREAQQIFRERPEASRLNQ
ncbi:unnamed protein product, partial [Prorocentrum cordatum]